MNERTDGRTDGQTDVSMDRWIDGSMDRRKNGRTVGWMDREWKLDINHKIYVPLKTSTTLLTFFNSSSFFDLKTKCIIRF